MHPPNQSDLPVIEPPRVRPDDAISFIHVDDDNWHYTWHDGALYHFAGSYKGRASHVANREYRNIQKRGHTSYNRLHKYTIDYSIDHEAAARYAENHKES
jgi:hypothetical protein